MLTEVFKALQSLGPTHKPLQMPLSPQPCPTHPLALPESSGVPEGCSRNIFHFLLSHSWCLLFILCSLSRAPPSPGGPPCPSLSSEGQMLCLPCILGTEVVIISSLISFLCLSWSLVWYWINRCSARFLTEASWHM